jgi:hypothetical protein
MCAGSGVLLAGRAISPIRAAGGRLAATAIIPIPTISVTGILEFQLLFMYHGPVLRGYITQPSDCIFQVDELA